MIEGSYVPALTPDAMSERGWTKEHLVQFFRTGMAPQGSMTFRMYPVLEHSTSRMPEAYLKAMAGHAPVRQALCATRKA